MDLDQRALEEIKFVTTKKGLFTEPFLIIYIFKIRDPKSSSFPIGHILPEAV
jgi:hypothetical protein